MGALLPQAVVRDDHGDVDELLVYRDIALGLDHRPQLAGPWILTAQYLLPFHFNISLEIWATFTKRFVVETPQGAWVRLHADTDMQDPRATCIAAFVAREMGDDARFEQLLAWADGHFEPRFDADTGEFAYWFGLGEPYPRGQFNNAIMNAFVAPHGTWTGLLA